MDEHAGPPHHLLGRHVEPHAGKRGRVDVQQAEGLSLQTILIVTEIAGVGAENPIHGL
ncbi:hypothetical protein AB0H83_41395 [Dactylosporangium sp. NPDC050688]|uniref:hypothetical protein n=1 Tax=Dactylosporangium sp. NPDC050688 TaxID=3157217 RepID=UPI003408299F